jgi:hypothetical protein
MKGGICGRDKLIFCRDIEAAEKITNAGCLFYRQRYSRKLTLYYYCITLQVFTISIALAIWTFVNRYEN